MTFKNSGHHLHRYHLFLLLGVRNALLVLPSLKGELFLVSLFLLLDQRLHKLFSFHFLRILKIWFFSLRLLPYAREKGSDSLLLSDIEACNALFKVLTLATADKTLPGI